jgi:hypothetical protein
VPDVIINFYSNTGDIAKTRVGYIRIPAADVTSKSPKPQWIRIKNPNNDNPGKTAG